jgi:hypothetical protein
MVTIENGKNRHSVYELGEKKKSNRPHERRVTMAFRIEKTEDFIEVHLWSEAHESEVVAILRKYEMAPRKEISDLWLFAEEYVIPWDAFSEIVKEVTQFLSTT